MDIQTNAEAARAAKPLSYAERQRNYRRRLRARLSRDPLANLPDSLIEGLPKLKGSERQIEWATQIRSRILGTLLRLAKGGELSKEIRRYAAFPLWGYASVCNMARVLPRLTANDLKCAVEVMCAIDSAAWWIEGRNCDPGKLVVQVLRDTPVRVAAEEDLEYAKAIASSTIRPEDEEDFNGVVIEMGMPSPYEIRIWYPGYSPRFNECIKPLRFGWSDPFWMRNTDANENVFIGVAHELLDRGYGICIFDDRLRTLVENGESDLEPVPDRIIEAYRGKRDTRIRFRIKWRAKDPSRDQFCHLLSQVKSAKIFDDAALVAQKDYEVIQDLANTHDFIIMESAQMLIEAEQAALLKGKPVKAKVRRYGHRESGNALPAATGEVDESLLDD